MLSWWGMSPAHVGFITRLFVTRFRPVGTLVPHGKAGVFTLLLYNRDGVDPHEALLRQAAHVYTELDSSS